MRNGKAFLKEHGAEALRHHYVVVPLPDENFNDEVRPYLLKVTGVRSNNLDFDAEVVGTQERYGFDVDDLAEAGAFVLDGDETTLLTELVMYSAAMIARESVNKTLDDFGAGTINSRG